MAFPITAWTTVARARSTTIIPGLLGTSTIRQTGNFDQNSVRTGTTWISLQDIKGLSWRDLQPETAFLIWKEIEKCGQVVEKPYRRLQGLLLATKVQGIHQGIVEARHVLVPATGLYDAINNPSSGQPDFRVTDR
jgi:hypothetical protein